MSQHMDAGTGQGADGHPSQAEGDVGDDELSGDVPTTDPDGTPVENPSGG